MISLTAQSVLLELSACWTEVPAYFESFCEKLMLPKPAGFAEEAALAGDSGALAADELGAADDFLDFFEVVANRGPLHFAKAFGSKTHRARSATKDLGLTPKHSRNARAKWLGLE